DRLGHPGDPSYISGVGGDGQTTQGNQQGAGVDPGSYVPYSNVYSDFYSYALTTLDRDYVPRSIKDYVKDYFSSLNPTPSRRRTRWTPPRPLPARPSASPPKPSPSAPARSSARSAGSSSASASWSGRRSPGCSRTATSSLKASPASARRCWSGPSPRSSTA